MKKYKFILALLSTSIMGAQTQAADAGITVYGQKTQHVHIFPVVEDNGKFQVGLVEGQKYLTSICAAVENSETVKDRVTAHMSQNYSVSSMRLETLFHFEAISAEGKLTDDYYVVLTKNKIPGLAYLEAGSAPAFYPEYKGDTCFKRLDPNQSTRIFVTQEFIYEASQGYDDPVKKLGNPFQKMILTYGASGQATGRVTVSPEVLSYYVQHRAERAARAKQQCILF